MPYSKPQDRSKAEQRSYHKNHDRNKARKLSNYYRNRDSRLAKMKKNYEELKNNPEEYNKKKKQWNANRLLKQYGLTEAQVCSMKELQENKCLICKKETKLYIDHCHSSGKVRGLLCNSCNVALGFLEENIETMKNMILYIEKSLDYIKAGN